MEKILDVFSSLSVFISWVILFNSYGFKGVQMLETPLLLYTTQIFLLNSKLIYPNTYYIQISTLCDIDINRHLRLNPSKMELLILLPPYKPTHSLPIFIKCRFKVLILRPERQPEPDTFSSPSPLPPPSKSLSSLAKITAMAPSYTLSFQTFSTQESEGFYKLSQIWLLLYSYFSVASQFIREKTKVLIKFCLTLCDLVPATSLISPFTPLHLTHCAPTPGMFTSP